MSKPCFTRVQIPGAQKHIYVYVETVLRIKQKPPKFFIHARGFSTLLRKPFCGPYVTERLRRLKYERGRRIRVIDRFALIAPQPVFRTCGKYKRGQLSRYACMCVCVCTAQKIEEINEDHSRA